LSKVYWKEQVVWSPGFFISTVGINEKQIIQYVKWQQNQDSGQAKLALFFIKNLSEIYLSQIDFDLSR